MKAFTLWTIPYIYYIHGFIAGYRSGWSRGADAQARYAYGNYTRPWFYSLAADVEYWVKWDDPPWRSID